MTQDKAPKTPLTTKGKPRRTYTKRTVVPDPSLVRVGTGSESKARAYGRGTIRQRDAPRVIEVDQQVWLMRVEGLSTAEIAQRLDCDAETVRTAMKRVLAYKREVGRTFAEDAFDVQVARLELLHSAYFPRAVGGVITDPVTGSPVIDTKTGLPVRYALDHKAGDKVLQIHDRVAKLYGLETLRVELTGANGGAVEVAHRNVGALSPEELAIVEHLLRKANGLSTDIVDGEIVDPPESTFEGEGG